MHTIGQMWYSLLREGEDHDTVMAAIRILFWVGAVINRKDDYARFWAYLDTPSLYIDPDEQLVYGFINAVAPSPNIPEGRGLLWEFGFILGHLNWPEGVLEPNIDFINALISASEVEPIRFPDLCVPLQALWNYRSRLRHLSDANAKERLVYSLLVMIRASTMAGNMDSYWDTNTDNSGRKLDSISQCLELIRTVSRGSPYKLQRRPNNSSRYILDELGHNLCGVWGMSKRLGVLVLDFFDTVKTLNEVARNDEGECPSPEVVVTESSLHSGWKLIHEVSQDAFPSGMGRHVYLHTPFRYIRRDFSEFLSLLIKATKTAVSDRLVWTKALPWIENVEKSLVSVRSVRDSHLRVDVEGGPGLNRQKAEELEMSIKQLGGLKIEMEKEHLVQDEKEPPSEKQNDRAKSIYELHPETAEEEARPPPFPGVDENDSPATQHPE